MQLSKIRVFVIIALLGIIMFILFSKSTHFSAEISIFALLEKVFDFFMINKKK